ncbi:MAG TPA: hypothetical protein VG711_10815, partial [Phycisphaerales bacterium]|nr:hypothetical protein [Phycisphaerales bacterium]
GGGVEIYTITSITHEEKSFQGHRATTLECTCRQAPLSSLVSTSSSGATGQRVAGETVPPASSSPSDSSQPTTQSSYILVRTAQPLGTLAVYLLEPQSEDGLATWNFFDDSLTVGSDFPILRIPNPIK